MTATGEPTPRVEARSDEAAWRLKLLADAGALLSCSLEWRTTVAGVARLALGRFADWTVIDYLDDRGRAGRLSVQHSDPAKAALAAEYVKLPPVSTRPSSIWLALRTGRSQLVTHASAAVLDEAARHQRSAALAREMGQASFIVVPLVARERILGALTFARGSARTGYTDADLAFAEEIARRAALAMDNARLLRNARAAEEESRRAAGRLRVLADASRLFAEAHLDLPRVLDAIASHVAVALFGKAVVLIADPAATGRALPIALGGLPDVPKAEIDRLRSCALAAMGQPFAELDPAALSHEAIRACCPFLGAVHGCAMLVSPMLCEGRTFGGLAVWRTDALPASFTCEDQALLEDLAARAALSLESAHLYRQATEAVSVRDSFLSIAGHELKTPLTALQLQVRCLSAEAKGPRVSKVARQCERLVSLVDELLDVSRITAGRLRLELNEMDLREMVLQIVRQLADDLGRADCEVNVDAPPEPVLGFWDRLRMEHVVANLLSNAMKYGCGRPIDLTVSRRGDRARLEVRDRGIGIAPEDQSRIFARFERAVSSRHFGGLGLGLWIARQVVEAHSGVISVASTPGQGATFAVDLPLRPLLSLSHAEVEDAGRKQASAKAMAAGLRSHA